jgi:ADP-ribosylglycohydrolase
MNTLSRHYPVFRNITVISTVFSLALLSPSCVPKRPVPSNLNETEFRDKVYACWLGKNIGGTLGMPFEGRREPNDVTFYTNVKSGEPAANDDLDLQILWLKALQDHGGKVEARILADYWLRNVPVDWNEYGVCKANLRRGILPPLSGEFNNSQWKNSNGAWIRSEIWACLAPGCPGLAARMAREDACVDHGSAEGTYAEIFTASLESAAFVEHDRDRLIAYGLSMIPEDSKVARAVSRVVRSKQEGRDWKAAREDVIRETEDTGWFQAPRNVAFTIVGWLYGDGDFGKSICIAVNCGDDTDCTGATLGSIFGIIGGTNAIPDRWREPIGDGIRTVAIAGLPVPADLHELTDSTVAMTKRVLRMNAMPVMISEAPTVVRNPEGLLSEGGKSVRSLWNLSPYRIDWTEPGFRVTLDYAGDPILKPGIERKVRLNVENLSTQPREVRVQWHGLPAGWDCGVMPSEMQRFPEKGQAVFELAVSATDTGITDPAMSLRISADGDTVVLPLFFKCQK